MYTGPVVDLQVHQSPKEAGLVLCAVTKGLQHTMRDGDREDKPASVTTH